MWTVAGVLLGFVVIATLLGFHVGPHSHLAAGVVGVIAAAWLLLMAANGYAQPLLWVAFGADTVLAVGFGTAALRGIHAEHATEHLRLATRIVGSEGIAESDLDPDGVVRVGGETWSATAGNGRISKGSRIQVIEAKGLRLVVWGDDANSELGSPFEIEQHFETGEQPGEQRTGTT